METPGVPFQRGILPEEGYLAEEKPPPQLFQDESVVGIHPRWVAWLRGISRQTPISQNNRTEIVGPMLMACRWLAHRHPHITEPGQWTRELAVQYVAYVCNEATIFDYASPERKQLFANHLQQRQGEPLKATGIRKRIDSVRNFFRCLQKYSYEVNGRLELGQHLSPTAMQTTEFAPALEASQVSPIEQALPVEHAPTVLYGPAQWARTSFTGGFPGSAFTLQPDGSLLCPSNRPLYPQERRPERDGSYRLLYAARIRDCRCCPLRAQCQESSSTTKPRRVSAVFWPIASPQLIPSIPVLQPPLPLPKRPEQLPQYPVLWGDWPRCQIRRNWLKVVRTETVMVMMGATPTQEQAEVSRDEVITRAQRAHWRLTWNERLARNARLSTAPPLTFTIHGLSATFANAYGFGLLTTA